LERHPNGQAIVVDADRPIARFAEELPELPPLSESELRRPVEYRGYRELLESWGELENARAQIIGRSHGGEPLWMVEIGNPAASKVSAVIAGIHPIEWIGIESCLQIAQEHAKNPCSDRRVCFFPLANPDGFRKVEDNLRQKRRKWVRSNDAGVDLNRNWPTHFKKKRGLIAGHNNSGPSPLSEPEIAAIVGALDEISEKATIDVALSLHSIGKMILMPWGGKWKAPEARERHLQVAKELRARLGRYTIRQVSHWVPGISFAHGMEIDHLHERYGATAILIECTRGELGWFRPQVLLDPFRIFNPRDGRHQAQSISEAMAPFVRGQL
jgi:hypothetical protein